MIDIDKTKIREIELEDFSKGCLELYEQSFDMNAGIISQKEFTEYILRKRKYNYKIFVYEYKRKIISIATCFVEEKLIHNFGKVSHIEDVIVDKNIRKSGLGKAMIEKCISYSNSEDSYKIILDCSIQNKFFYEKCGFEEKGCYMALYKK
tara:strand:- start:5047 stop:5496 length:450 start_codon:yes stop_codon:yes gene_type:complete